MRNWKLAVATGALALAGVTPTAFASTKTQSYVETTHGWVDFHSSAQLSSPIVGRLQLGDRAPLVQKANSYWYEIQWNGQDVYITTNSSYTHVVTETTSTPSSGTTSSGNATNTSGQGGTGSAAPTSSPSNSSTSTNTGTEPAWQQEADKVIAVAKTQLDVPYLWGKQEPGIGFDCSNFTAWAYNTALGIRFSGSSVWQFNNEGTPVPLNQIREGDLLFFAVKGNATGSGHVGIYEGNGMVIQEGGGWGKVTEEPLATTWLGKNLVVAKRVIN
jgi:cell wall-associated NlpC family hydrolase